MSDELSFPEGWDADFEERLRGLAARARKDPGLLADPVTVEAAALLKVDDPVGWARLAASVRAVRHGGQRFVDAVERHERESARAAAAALAKPAGPAPAGDVDHDQGRAAHFVRRHGDGVRYDAATGRWLLWDGRRWAEDDREAVPELARQSLAELAEQAATAAAYREALSARARRSALELARGQSPVACGPEDFDADPWLLNTLSGLVDLRTGALRPHDRAALCSQLAGARYRPDGDLAALCPRWLRFLEEAMPDPEVREFVRRYLGKSTTGAVHEHVFVIHFGAAGRNGKGTLLELVAHALGSYARSVRPELFVKRRGDEAHPTEIADMRGRRLVFASELENGKDLNEARVKLLTGGDTLSARGMRQDFFTFRPTHTLHLQTNYLPTIHGTDGGIWSRLRVVPWTVSFLGREDYQLPGKLRAEADGILTWLVRAAVDYHARGLPYPEVMRRALEEHRGESDEVGRFLVECCHEEATLTVNADELHKAYCEWAERRGNREPLNATLFGTRLSAKGWNYQGDGQGRRKSMRKGRVFYLGLRLLSLSERSQRNSQAADPVPTEGEG